jgi:hypothetical protein
MLKFHKEIKILYFESVTYYYNNINIECLVTRRVVSGLPQNWTLAILTGHGLTPVPRLAARMNSESPGTAASGLGPAPGGRHEAGSGSGSGLGPPWRRGLSERSMGCQ